MKTAFYAAALAATTALATGPALAQMSDGRGQLEITAERALDQAGIAYPVENLSVAQLTEIKELVETETGDRTTELYTILEIDNPDAVPVPTLPDRAQLELIAQSELDEAGIEVDATTLSTAQLTAIKAAAEDDNANMAQELETIVKG